MIRMVQAWNGGTTGTATAPTTVTAALPVAPSVRTPVTVQFMVVQSGAPVVGPAGWLTTLSYANYFNLYIFYRYTQPGDTGSVALTITAPTVWAMCEVANLGADPAWGSAQASTSNNSIVANTAVVGDADSFVISVAAEKNTTRASWGAFSGGFTKRFDSVTNTPGNNYALSVADLFPQAAGRQNSSVTATPLAGGFAGGVAQTQGWMVGFRVDPTVQIATPAKITSLTTFGTPAVSTAAANATVTPATLVSTSTFGAATVAATGQTVVSPATFVSALRTNQFVLTVISSTVTPDLLTLGLLTPPPVSVAGVTVTTPTPTILSLASTFPAPTIVVTSAVDATVNPATMVSGSTFPTAVAFTGTAVVVTPPTLLLGTVFYTPTSTSTAITVFPSTFLSSSIFAFAPAQTPTVVYLFIPPVVYDVPTQDLTSNLLNGLMAHYSPGPRGVSVWKLKNGTYTIQQPAMWDDVEKVWYGGHEEVVSTAEAAALTAAGFAVTQIEG
jgi:hypothetical protein